MANAQRGYVPIEIGEEEYQLRLDFNAVATADNRLGTSVLQALAASRFDAIQAAIAVGLANGRNARGAPKEAVKALDARKLDYYVERILDALEASGVIEDKSDDEEDPDPGEASASSGGRSDGGPSTSTQSAGLRPV